MDLTNYTKLDKTQKTSDQERKAGLRSIKPES